MALTVVKDHEEQGVALLLDQFKNKPRLEAWLRIYLRQVQLLDDATYDVMIARMIDLATGAQLDLIGKIVGERRLGRTDTEFRVFIYVRIQANRSAGTTPELLKIIELLSSPTPAHYDEYYPASILLEFAELTPRDPRTIYHAVQGARAGGVRLNFVVPTTTPDLQFLYSDVGDTDVGDNGYGAEGDPEQFGLLGGTYGPSTPYTFQRVLLESVEPDAGPVAGGTTILITGSGFYGPVDEMAITLDGVACTSLVRLNYREMQCVTPEGAGVGTVALSVTVSGESDTLDFEYE